MGERDVRRKEGANGEWEDKIGEWNGENKEKLGERERGRKHNYWWRKKITDR